MLFCQTRTEINLGEIFGLHSSRLSSFTALSSELVRLQVLISAKHIRLLFESRKSSKITKALFLKAFRDFRKIGNFLENLCNLSKRYQKAFSIFEKFRFSGDDNLTSEYMENMPLGGCTECTRWFHAECTCATL